jgi:hypothetical protein
MNMTKRFLSLWKEWKTIHEETKPWQHYRNFPASDYAGLMLLTWDDLATTE